MCGNLAISTTRTQPHLIFHFRSFINDLMVLGCLCVSKIVKIYGRPPKPNLENQM